MAKSFSMKFKDKQLEYSESYANMVGLKYFVEGANKDISSEIAFRKKLFLRGFEKYVEIPEEIRNQFSKNNELEKLAEEYNYTKT